MVVDAETAAETAAETETEAVAETATEVLAEAELSPSAGCPSTKSP